MSAEIGPIPETEFTKPKSKFVKLSSIRNSKSKGGEDEKKKQIQDYVVWVNSYLKTRPGIPLISDLKGGMQDGISLVNVVESAANAEIPFIVRKPSSSSARKSNIEKAIAFLKSDGAIFAGDPVKDIHDGNIKGIMKIILVIAEKYNPRSVRPIEQKLSTSTTSSSSSHHHMPSSSQPLSVPSTAGRSPERMRGSNNNSNALSTSPGRGLSPIPQSHPLPHVPHRQSNPQPHSQSHLQPLPQPHSQSHSHPHSQPHSQPYPRSHSQSNAHFQSYPQSQPSQTQTQSHSHHSHHFNGNNVPLQGYALSQGFAMSQNFGASMGGGFGMTGDTTDDAVVTGGPGGYSLSQPVGGAQQQQQSSEDIYTDPIDSLPKNVTQRISSQMPGSRVIGQKLPPKVHNRLSVPSSKTNPGGSPQQHSPAAAATENIVIKEAPVVPAESKQETTQKPQDNTLIYGEVNGALSGLGELKIELLKLHTVLLDNVGDDDTSEASKVDMKLPMEVANSEIMTKDKEIGELQEEIEKSKTAFTKLESECETLKEMVMERNQFITGMKTEIYRKEYRNDTEKVDLQTQLLHKDRKIKILEGEINLMKASVEGKEREMVEIRKKRAESETRECEYQEEVTKIQSELARAIEAEEALQAKLFSRDRKISHLEEKLEHERGFLQRVNPSVVSEDMDSVREMLVSLRESMEPGDTNQQTLDKLEKNISTMITKFTDHVRSISPGRKPPRRHHDERRDDKKKRHRDRGESRSSRDEVFERPYHPLPSSTTGEWTKVFYYITGDKMETPYCTSVPRKASEVRLKDFKAVFDRHGSYRFYFKTEDPDCGVVREEIINDENILPAWNGKIMVWVTEKAHHHR